MKFVLLALIATGAISGCGGEEDSRRTAYYNVTVTPAPALGKEALVTYSTSSGTSQSRTLGGSFGFPVDAQEGKFLYVSVQNPQATGVVTAEIQVDGETWKKSTSSAPYGIATATGTCCNK